MTRLNKKVEYALMALRFLSARPSDAPKVSVKEICEATGAPFDATARVMQVMAQHELLSVEHGVHGGYSLKMSPSKVSLYELMAWILGPIEVAKCIGSIDQCDMASTCNIVDPVKTLNNKVVQFYSSLPLSDVIHASQ